MYCSIRHRSRIQGAAFTLVELLVVLLIIALIAGIGIPAIKGLRQSDTTLSAQRQMLDDLAHARQLAIANRSDVYVVFAPPQVFFPTTGNPDYVNPNTLSDAGRQVYTNLMGNQYRAYALLAERQVGDQPGVHTPRYLTDWRTLPEGIFIATNKFWRIGAYAFDEVKRSFVTNSIPFPLATNQPRNLPVIVFDSSGRLKENIYGTTNVVIPLIRGSIFYARDANGMLTPGPPDIVENLNQNLGTANPDVVVTNWIRVDWLTGRARVEQQEIQNP